MLFLTVYYYIIVKFFVHPNEFYLEMIYVVLEIRNYNTKKDLN